MSRATALLALAALCGAPGCAGDRAAGPGAAGEPTVLRSAELARVRCLLVAPLENGSDAPTAGESATAALLGGAGAAGVQVYPLSELRAIFQGTPLELPAGFGPALAQELAGIVGADAALFGAVEGRSRDATPELLVSVRLALSGNNELLFARTALVRPGRGEQLDGAIRREVIAAARPMLENLGDAGGRPCFDPRRARALRGLALGQVIPAAAGSATRAPPSAPTSPTSAAASASSASASPAPARPPASVPAPVPTARVPSAPPRTPRQVDWAKRLAGGERLLLEDVAFAGRTAELQRDAGLADLAVAFGTVPDGALRVEGFVDTTPDRAGDVRLSTAMAETAAQRLAALGVPRGRVAWSGRGGDAPLLPNFTARGRATNRRLEVVVVR